MGDTNPQEQLDQFKALSQAASPGDAEAVPSIDAAKNLSTAAMIPTAGIIVPTQQPAATSSAAPAPSPSAPAPGSFGSILGQAVGKLMSGGMDTMSALVAGGVHALSLENRPKPSVDTGTPSNISWAQATSGNDRSQPTAPVNQPKPSNAQTAINSIAANLGDISAATEGGTAGGPIAGAFRVAKAQTERREHEQENQIKMATANAQMLREQQLLHKTTEDAVNASAAIGKQSADEMLTAPRAELLASDKTSDDLQRMIKDGIIDPSRDAVFLTGRTQVGTDTNGAPIMRSVYSVVKPGEKIAPSADQIRFLNENIPGGKFKEPDEDGKGGQEFDSHTFYMLNQRANNLFTMRQAVVKATAETEDKVHKALLQSGSEALRNNSFVQAAIAAVPSAKDDPFLFQRAFNVLAREAATDPNVRASLPKNWEEQFAYTFGGGNAGKFEDQMKKYSELQQRVQDAGQGIISSYIGDPAKFEGKTEGITVAAESVLKDPNATREQKQQATQALTMAKDQARYEIDHDVTKEKEKEKAKNEVEGTGTNGSTETGEAFLKTLDPSRRAVIQGYVNGLSEWTPRLGGSKYGQSLLRDIRQYMPEWDESKAPAYFKMRQNFTSGKEATGINAANTAMHHLNLMWNGLNSATVGQTGRIEQFLGFNQSGRTVANAAHAVAAELGRLYIGGVVGEKEAEEWREKLNPNQTGMTVSKLRDNVKDFVKLLGGKLQSWQDQWNDGVPSDNIRFQKGFISQENLNTYQNVTGQPASFVDVQKSPAGQQTQQQTPVTQQAPAGGITVNTPAGSFTFKTQAEADAFRKAAGL